MRCDSGQLAQYLVHLLLLDSVASTQQQEVQSNIAAQSVAYGFTWTIRCS